MSIERELLKRFMTELKTEEDVVSLFNDIKECLAQPEQTEQEPVAWMQDSIELYVLEEKSAIRGYVIPLYTAPPKREPLGDEEIHKLSLENFKGLLSDRINFVRAIEKEHGIGGGE